MRARWSRPPSSRARRGGSSIRARRRWRRSSSRRCPENSSPSSTRTSTAIALRSSSRPRPAASGSASRRSALGGRRRTSPRRSRRPRPPPGRRDPLPEHDRREEQQDGYRPFWSGTITFGLVSVPVDLLPANRPRRVSLRMLAPDGTPLKREYWSAGGQEAVESEQTVHAYELDNGKFVEVTDEELEELGPRKTREIDLRLFVDKDELDPVFFERAYFLAPSKGANKPYRLLVSAMESTSKAGIATFVMREREYLVAIIAENGLLRAETMRFAGATRPRRPPSCRCRRRSRRRQSGASRRPWRGCSRTSATPTSSRIGGHAASRRSSAPS